MGTTNYFAPWVGHREGFAASPSPLDESGSVLQGGKTDDKSAIVKTPRGKWRRPLAYSRLIVTGDTQRPKTTIIVTYSGTSFAGKRKMSIAGTCASMGLAGYTLGSASVPFPADMAVRVEQRAFRKLKQQNINLSVAFGERAATSEHVALTAGRVLKGLQAAMDFNPRKVAKALKVPPLSDRRVKRAVKRGLKKGRKASHSLWLEYQYGWRPLLSDAYGAVRELHESDQRMTDRYRATCTAKDEQLVKDFVGFDDVSPYNLIRVDGSWMSTRTRHRAYCRLDWVLTNPFLASMSELGMTNPAETAWELVPFSFVADWFIPLGAYLSSMDTGVGWSFKGGSMSRLTRSERKFAWGDTYRLATTFARDVSGYTTSGISKQRLVRLTRTVYTVAPQPWLPGLFSGDGLKVGKRAWDAIALLSAAFR